MGVADTDAAGAAPTPLARALDAEPLPEEHGAPLCLVMRLEGGIRASSALERSTWRLRDRPTAGSSPGYDRFAGLRGAGPE